jgi:hypothetical protein
MSKSPVDLNQIWPTHGVIFGTPPSGVMRYVALTPTDYVVPQRFEVFFTDGRMPYDVSLEVFMDESDGPQCRKCEITQRHDGEAVSAVGFRSVPLAALLQQAARFMAYEVTEDAEGTPQFVPAKASQQSRDEIVNAWRWARAASRRATFPATVQNLTTVGRLVEEALALAEAEDRSPTVYADVKRQLEKSGEWLSRATVQRRIESAQEQGLAPRWKETS